MHCVSLQAYPLIEPHDTAELPHPQLQRLTRRAPFINFIIGGLLSMFTPPPPPPPKEQAANEEARIYGEAENAQAEGDENAAKNDELRSDADKAKQKAQEDAKARMQKEKEEEEGGKEEEKEKEKQKESEKPDQKVDKNDSSKTDDTPKPEPAMNKETSKGDNKGGPVEHTDGQQQPKSSEKPASGVQSQAQLPSESAALPVALQAPSVMPTTRSAYPSNPAFLTGNYNYSTGSSTEISHGENSTAIPGITGNSDTKGQSTNAGTGASTENIKMATSAGDNTIIFST
ncbi:hypothetical protein IWQ62_005265 [Dispira parvispora]|uniref:Uncharacterized protein n=1 Tax=Dispira parvispora TaxID=1520584 RepID=A0A9W8AQR8_9FUNG|nr:hypothetical protein IWQ62_005265 [Dispira parvispora]